MHRMGSFSYFSGIYNELPYGDLISVVPSVWGFPVGFVFGHSIRAHRSFFGRMFDVLTGFGDEFPVLSQWPAVWRELFFKEHKSNRERFRLFCFLWRNGMMPSHCVFWVLVHRGYDQSAWRDLCSMASKTATVDGVQQLTASPLFVFSSNKVE